MWTPRLERYNNLYEHIDGNIRTFTSYAVTEAVVIWAQVSTEQMMRLLNPLMVGVVIYLATGDPGVPPCYRQLSK